MSNKRQFSDSDFPLHNDTPRTPSKRASGASRLQTPDLQSPGGANQGISRFNGFIFNKPDPQSPGGANQGVSKFGVLDFNKPDPQSPGGANQHTPRKIADVLLSLGRTHSPLKGSTYSWTSRAFDAAQYADNPFLSHEQPSQPEQEKSSCEGNVLSPARLGSSSDDSDSSSDTSPDTSPTKPACTPKKSVAKPTHHLLSPIQFLSSPTQAVLETLIPLLDEQNEDSDDVGPQHFSRPQAIRLCQEVFNCTPKVEQLEVLSQIARKIDCVLIAPCGWGKTLAFFLPMVLWPYRITVIISPLIALMNDQQQKLVKARIPHIVLSGDNSDAINGDLINRIIEGEFRAVFMSPEIIFGDSPTSKLVQGLWHNTLFQNQLLAIVVDEVHCVEKWGQKFRPEYDRLGELRIWSPGVPFVGVTATLTADALAQTMSKLFLSKANIIRVQEMPTNVRLEVHTQPKDAKKGLNRLLGEDKTIIYFEKISILIDIHKYLTRTRPDQRNRLGVYYSTLASKYKEAAMTMFMEGDIHILLATEAAGNATITTVKPRQVQYQTVPLPWKSQKRVCLACSGYHCEAESRYR